MLASIGERIGHYRAGGLHHPNRMVGNAPIAVAALEDKIVQKGYGCGWLSAIYEEDFLGFLVWIPSRTRHATMRWMRSWSGSQHKGELDTGRRHPLVLRHGEPGGLIKFVEHRVRATDVSSAYPEMG